MLLLLHSRKNDRFVGVKAKHSRTPHSSSERRKGNGHTFLYKAAEILKGSKHKTRTHTRTHTQNLRIYKGSNQTCLIF